MDADRRVGDLVRELVHHLQDNPNPNPKDVKYAIRILSSGMTPLLVANEAAIANSIKTQMAKQGKLSDALSFTDLYSKFASKTGPGSVNNKRSVLYLLKVISEDIKTNPRFQINQINDNSTEIHGYSSRNLKNGGILSISRDDRNSRDTVYKEFGRIVNEENDVSENSLVFDVLTVCEGSEGKYVKFDDNVDGYVLLDSVKVNKANRVMVRKLCELGWLFRKVNGYIIENSVSDTWTVSKAFCVAIQDELLEYHKLLNVLKSQSMNPIPLTLDHVGSKGYLSLRRLSVWLVEPTVRMRRIAVIVDSCKDLKGGAMVSEIYLHTQHGDPLFRDLMKRLLHKVCLPLFEMVRSWVMEGYFRDLYSEFFVSEQSVKAECLWREGYRINNLMLPSFISKSLANRILTTGKSINFLKVCCDDNSWANLGSDAKLVTGYGETNALETFVTEASKRIDKHLIDVIFDKYKFKKHCLAIKRYILLGQGDFVQYLMEIAGPVLSERADKISLIQVRGLLEKAILSSSAQYDDRDFLDRLTVKMMPHKHQDNGWDVFCLYYHARAPLNTVFTEYVMDSYLKIFNFLWKIRRVEHAVLNAWKTMKPNLVTDQFFNELPKVVRFKIVLISRKCQVLWDEMNHFLTNLQSYIMFEVLEVTWVKFCNEMETAKDFDDLIAAHDKYLNTIVEKSLIGESCEGFYKTLLMLFDVVLRFCGVADRLYEGINDFRTRSTKNKTKEAKHSKSKGSEAEPWLNEGRKAITKRAGEFLNNIGQELDTVSKEYSSILKGFISELPSQQNIDLKFLMFRLDFTEYYK